MLTLIPTISIYYAVNRDAVMLLAEQRTCDSQVSSSSPGWASLRSGLGKLLTPVRLCHQAV